MENKLLSRIIELSGQPLNELFINEPDIKTDEDIVRLSIIAELDAVNLYKKLASQTKNQKLKKVLLDIAEEEEVHIGEFEAMLSSINPDFVSNKKKGEREVKKI